MANQIIPDHIWYKRRLKQLKQFRILAPDSLNRYYPMYSDQGCANNHRTLDEAKSLVYYESYDALFLYGETSLYKIKPGPRCHWKDGQTYTKEIADCSILEAGRDASGLIISNLSCSQRVICVSEKAIVGQDKLVWINISHREYDEYFLQLMAQTLSQVQTEL